MNRRLLVPLAAVVVAGAQLGLGLSHGASLTRATAFRTTSPADGSTVAPNFVLSWQPLPGVSRYAIIVDQTPPPSGKTITSTNNRILATGISAVLLSLGSRSGGSPTLRNWHTVTIVPLDERGRRDGEQVAVVHVRQRAT